MPNVTWMLDLESKLVSPCQVMQVSWGQGRGGEAPGNVCGAEKRGAGLGIVD